MPLVSRSYWNWNAAFQCHSCLVVIEIGCMSLSHRWSKTDGCLPRWFKLLYKQSLDNIYTISSRDSPPLLKVLLKRRRSEKMDFYGALYRATWKKDFFFTFFRRDSPAARSCTISSRDSSTAFKGTTETPPLGREKMDFYGALYRATWKKDFFFTFFRRDSPAMRSCYRWLPCDAPEVYRVDLIYFKNEAHIIWIIANFRMVCHPGPLFAENL